MSVSKKTKFWTKHRKHSKRVPRSLFTHLVFVLALAGVLINLTFLSYYGLRERPEGHLEIFRMLNHYTTLLGRELGSPPNAKSAHLLKDKFNINIAYYKEGKLTWTTGKRLPSLKKLYRKLHHHKYMIGRYSSFQFKILPLNPPINSRIKSINFSKEETQSNSSTQNTEESKDNSFFNFAWNHEEHDRYTSQLDSINEALVFYIEKPTRYSFIIPFLIVFTLILFVAWRFLRKLLIPVRDLENAVHSVANGNLNTKLILTRPRELVKTANDFNSMVKKIRSMMEDKQQILRDVSHELKTPIARVKLTLALLPKSADRNSAEEDLRHLENIVEEILLASRLENIEEGKSNKESHPFKNVNISDIVKETCKSISKLYPNKIVSTNIVGHLADYQAGKTLKFKTKQSSVHNNDHNIKKTDNLENDIYIEASEQLLKRLITNLLENALKYSTETNLKEEKSIETTGTTKSKKATGTDESKETKKTKENNTHSMKSSVDIILDSTSNLITLIVSDKGPGIPLDYHEKIFEPFFQIDPSRTPTALGANPGVGLGLYICRKITNLHKGSITVSQNKNNGSDFIVSLPLR